MLLCGDRSEGRYRTASGSAQERRHPLGVLGAIDRHRARVGEHHRDACDLGYLVTLVPDACATLTEERQAASLRALAGYCRQRSTDALLEEIRAGTA